MKRLLVIGHVWPEPKTTAAGNRMLQLLKAFTKKNFDIIFASTASKTGYSHNLKKMGIVEEVLTGEDHLVRKAKIRMASSQLDKTGKPMIKPTILERPVQKLVVLVRTPLEP